MVNRSSSSRSISGRVSSIETPFGAARSGLFRGHVFERALKEFAEEYSSESSYSFILFILDAWFLVNISNDDIKSNKASTIDRV